MSDAAVILDFRLNLWSQLDQVLQAGWSGCLGWSRLKKESLRSPISLSPFKAALLYLLEINSNSKSFQFIKVLQKVGTYYKDEAKAKSRIDSFTDFSEPINDSA